MLMPSPNHGTQRLPNDDDDDDDENEKALDKFFIIAPELSKSLHEFAAEYVRQ